MDELAKAYETVEMLKALDLPISKDQLDNIESLEKENGKYIGKTWGLTSTRNAMPITQNASWISGKRKYAER